MLAPGAAAPPRDPDAIRAREMQQRPRGEPVSDEERDRIVDRIVGDRELDDLEVNELANMASELGLRVHGSGPGNSSTKEDLLAALRGEDADADDDEGDDVSTSGGEG
jgi:hypothetical protein